MHQEPGQTCLASVETEELGRRKCSQTLKELSLKDGVFCWVLVPFSLSCPCIQQPLPSVLEKQNTPQQLPGIFPTLNHRRYPKQCNGIIPLTSPCPSPSPTRCWPSQPLPPWRAQRDPWDVCLPFWVTAGMFSEAWTPLSCLLRPGQGPPESLQPFLGRGRDREGGQGPSKWQLG